MQNLRYEEQEIIALYRQMQVLMTAADTVGLAAILSEDFRLIHMTGYDQPGSEWLEHIRSGQMTYFSSEECSVSARVSGNKAALTGCNRVKANIWGAQGAWPLQLDIELVRHGSQWMMTHARASTF